jgi:predicted methyltransferase
MAFRALGLAVALALLPSAVLAQNAGPALATAAKGAQREAAHVARDGARHPTQSLEFWGLKPGMTVLEISPGTGYWSEILAPYALATKGRYIVAMGNPTARLPAKFENAATFGTINYTVFSRTSGPLAPAGSVDLILTARNIHNWIPQGTADKAMADFYAALKPGGILAVEEHRSDPLPTAEKVSTGYVHTNDIIALATKAGFRLAERSEINANPKDTKDHPYGVWTLPPTRRGPAAGAQPAPGYDRAKFDAIGESDRMTLRFVKP